MATYSTTETFCTQEQVFTVARYNFVAGGKPDDIDVYLYAQWTAASIQTATEAAGARKNPPTSGESDVALQDHLRRWNATGAAMLARRDLYLKTGSDKDRATWEALAAAWEAIMGTGSSGGGTSVGSGTGGELGTVIGTVANTGLLANEVTEGEITLPSLTAREEGITFTTQQKD